MEIILYTTHCPKCKVLETKLKQKNISYQECEDIEKMKEMGFKSAPVLSVDNNIYQFTDALNFLKTL